MYQLAADSSFSTKKQLKHKGKEISPDKKRETVTTHTLAGSPNNP
jgi:hypothetical protein